MTECSTHTSGYASAGNNKRDRFLVICCYCNWADTGCITDTFPISNLLWCLHSLVFRHCRLGNWKDVSRVEKHARQFPNVCLWVTQPNLENFAIKQQTKAAMIVIVAVTILEAAVVHRGLKDRRPFSYDCSFYKMLHDFYILWHMVY